MEIELLNGVVRKCENCMKKTMQVHTANLFDKTGTYHLFRCLTCDEQLMLPIGKIFDERKRRDK